MPEQDDICKRALTFLDDQSLVAAATRAEKEEERRMKIIKIKKNQGQDN